jgi:hypothetical protein
MEKIENKKGIVIFFNDEQIRAPKDTWTGQELREFLGVPSENRLYKEEPGAHPDILITPEMSIQIKNGDKFYDLPPGIKG